MAATGTNAARAWPYRRIVLGALAVSLVLNLFFIAGALWTRTHPAAPARGVEHYQQIAAQLDLDPQQRAAFDRFLAAARARNEKVRQQVAPLMAGAWEELAKPQADRAQVLRLFDEASEKRRQFQLEATAQILDFLAALSPAQRAKFVALARERRERWRSQPAQNR